MKQVLVAFEGPVAAVEQAIRDLSSVPGLQVKQGETTPGGPAQDGGVLSVIALIVGTVAGGLTIAEKVVVLREHWKKANPKNRLRAVLQDAKGNRLALENATVEQIAAALATLNG